jgi:hypothetical protein
MKTPRQILFQKHQSAESKLAKIRSDVIEEHFSYAVESSEIPRDSSRSLLLRLLKKLWRELCLPSRRIWTGLAAAWILILILNFSSEEKSRPELAEKPLQITPTEVRMALTEQQKLLAELVNGQPEEPVERQRFIPRPRSEIPAATRLV